MIIGKGQGFVSAAERPPQLIAPAAERPPLTAQRRDKARRCRKLQIISTLDAGTSERLLRQAFRAFNPAELLVVEPPEGPVAGQKLSGRAIFQNLPLA